MERKQGGKTGSVSSFWVLVTVLGTIQTWVSLTSHLRLCCQKAHISPGVCSRSRSTEADAGCAAGWLSAPCPGDFDLSLDVFKLRYCLSAGLGLILELRISWGARAVPLFHEEAECRAFKMTFRDTDCVSCVDASACCLSKGLQML